MPYGPHPDQWLHRISKGYQGVDPCEAKIIFLGLDANWPKKLCGDFQEAIRQYLNEPITYWKANHAPYSPNLFQPIHHPLLDARNPNDKRKDGVTYHRSFNDLHLGAQRFAECLSFVELLKIPTTGSTTTSLPTFHNLVLEPRNAGHLAMIENCLFLGGPKVIYVSGSVITALRAISSESRSNGTVCPDFSRFLLGPNQIQSVTPANPVVSVGTEQVANEVKVYMAYHFSASNASKDYIKDLRKHIDVQATRLGC